MSRDPEWYDYAIAFTFVLFGLILAAVAVFLLGAIWVAGVKFFGAALLAGYCFYRLVRWVAPKVAEWDL